MNRATQTKTQSHDGFWLCISGLQARPFRLAKLPWLHDDFLFTRQLSVWRYTRKDKSYPKHSCMINNKLVTIIPLGCTDERKECAAWAKQGECQKNPRYMMKFCRRSCGGCKQSRKPNVLR